MHYPTSTTPLFLRAGQPRRSYPHLGPNRIGECLLTAADTGGAFSLFDMTFGPGADVPPHVHTAEDKIYYVLEGRFQFQVGETLCEAGPGACVHVKKGTPQASLNLSDTPGRVLVFTTPGGFERFFDEWAEADDAPAGAEQDVWDKVSQLLPRYALEPGARVPQTLPTPVVPLYTGTPLDLGDQDAFIGVAPQDTDGAFFLAYQEVDRGGVIAPHIHAREDETYYILSGCIAIEVDGRGGEACPGDIVFAPRHLPRAWKVVGDEPVQLLLITTPGTNFSGFVHHLTRARRSCLTPPDLAALASEYGIEIFPE